jgi:hypothetical protein
MTLTTVAALWIAWMLLGEARYALQSDAAEDIGLLSAPHATGWVENAYVQAAGVLDRNSATRYSRVGERDSFRLSPVAGNPAVWVEIRVPDGRLGPRFEPPVTFVGRLVPYRRAGVGYAGLATVVSRETGSVVPEDAWLLIDGASPRSCRWALALTILLLGFAGWNLVGVARILARVRDAVRG